MPEVNSPASASPTQLAGMNPPSPQGADDLAGRVPGTDASAGQGGGPQKSSADAKLNQDVQQLRSMEAGLLEMAQSYPTATKALRSASEAIRAAQRQIVSSPGLQEPPVPNTTA